MNPMTPFTRLALREPSFYILLSLVGVERPGYSILKSVEDLSSGGLRLSTGELYGTLARLIENGLIERYDEPAGLQQGAAPKRYRLTSHGRRVIEIETGRLTALSAATRSSWGKNRHA